MAKFYHSDGFAITDVIYNADGEWTKVNNNIKLNKVYYDMKTEACKPYIKVYGHKYYLDEFIRDDL